MIEAKNITIGYNLGGGKKKIVHKDLSFVVEKGEMSALLGANGAGKSTLIKSLCGSTPLLSGDVLMNGKPIGNYSMSELSRVVGVVLTARPADGGLTVFDLVSFGRYPYIDSFGTLRDTDLEIIEKVMNDVGIAHLRDSYISQISDGERQKAMVAKVLAQQCQIIILDEPTAFLDVKSRLETYDLLHKIAHNQDKSILLSTHDLETTLRYADTLIMVSKYNKLIAGNTEDLILSGKVSRLFDGDDSSKVRFDDVDGSFRIENRCAKYVEVKGSDENAIFWLKNALLKNGIGVEGDLNTEGVVIVVNSSNDFILNESECCRSIQEVISRILKRHV